MPRAYADIAFTPSVLAAQRRHGIRIAGQQPASAAPVVPAATELSEREVAYIRGRNSFYLATVSETGWPYVQHRGGPVGFLKVLDRHTIGFADFRGNRQYLSVGNLAANDRVGLILLDHAQRRRLKIWGRARIVDTEAQPDWLARLRDRDYPGQVERGIVIDVHAYDWNCPQHIAPQPADAVAQL